MENGHFRHVSAGALLLAACALLAAVVGAASVVASELDYKAVKANAAHVLRIQGKWSGDAALFTAKQPAAAQMAAAATYPVD